MNCQESARTYARNLGSRIERNLRRTASYKKRSVLFNGIACRDALTTMEQGSKIRSTYIAFAHKERKRLEGVVETLSQEIDVKEKEVERLRGMTVIL
jgi:hypothetical protein